jgi:hypothetical protein
MSASPDLEEGSPEQPESRADDPLAEADGEATCSVIGRRNPRVYIRKDVADRLIKLGVPDDSGSLGHVVSQLAEMSISLGQAYLPDASDMAALQIAIHDRLDELNGTTLSLLKLLAVLGAAGEYKTLLHSFQQKAKESTPKV